MLLRAFKLRPLQLIINTYWVQVKIVLCFLRDALFVFVIYFYAF